jgi:intraflagellar transport protein 140
MYGEINHFNVNNKYLLVTTSNNFFGIYDISRRTLKQIMNFRKFEKNKQNLGEIREGSINCKGNYIGLLCDSLENQEIHIPETIFYVYDVELDSFTEHEISPNRIPIEFIWDFSDPRLFGVQTEYAKDLSEENYLNSDEKKKKEWYGSEFFIFFYTSEYGIKKQESHRINRDIQGIFSLCIPSIYFIISNTSNEEQIHSLMEKKFQFFQGLDKVDDNIKSALIDFSILMSSGKLDEAYKIVKNIKNPSIWENMAMICIKTKRLDVLEICLSNMRFSRGIRAVNLI